MIQALLASVAGLKAQQTQMNVIGNNLANVNTTAYKDQGLSFDDLVSQTLSTGSAPGASLGGTNPIQIGLGVTVGATTVNTSQGSLNATNVPSDLAIQGNGFFAVSDGQGVSYTRDGGFTVDADGNLVQASSGQQLLGWTASASGAIDTSKPIGTASTLKIPVGSATAVQATQNVTLDGNLAAGSASTADWSTQTTVYDSLGAAHQITVHFTNPQTPPPATPAPPAGATSSWAWTAYNAATGAAIGSSTDTGNTPLFFDANGAAVSDLAAGTSNAITLPASGGASATPINLNMSAISQLSETSTVSVQSQDGFPPGDLQNYSISATGVITGEFSNNITRPLGQVALVSFANPAGLVQTSQNLATSSVNSGLATYGTAGTGSAGTLSAGYLEQSNVDIGTEFTNLIVTQRGFEANTKIVTTVDQMLQDVVSMIQ
jgi:flagellar hook protein FlgE